MSFGPDKFKSNLTADTVIETSPGKLYSVVVTTAGAAGELHDAAAADATGAATLIAVVPATVGPVQFFGIPFYKGLVYKAGASQVCGVAYH